MNKSHVEAHASILGKAVKDRVTGFVGVVSSVCFDLYGCIQAAVTPPVDKEGKIVDSKWFDVNRLEVTDEKRVMPVPDYPAPAVFAHGPAEKPARDR